MPEKLHVFHFYGVNTHSLGSYLMGLGLLAACAQKWPNIRGCWRDGHFVLLMRDMSEETILDHLQSAWQPTEYSQRWWATSQKNDTKEKTDKRVWEDRNNRRDQAVRLLDSQMVGLRRNHFNILFGTGGNIGKRDLAKGFIEADLMIKKYTQRSRPWLRHSLFGEPIDELPDFGNASTWFVSANKRFNSGQKKWFKDGKISPWSFRLALEGALLFRGSSSKRLGSATRGQAAFPFVASAASPVGSGEVGKSKAELWAPLWSQPATLMEVSVLLSRGLAKVGNRGASWPHEFAVAALDAGVDFGLEAFAPFELRETTSKQVYEAIPREIVSVTESNRNDSELLFELLPWVDRLPPEPRRSEDKGRFQGLRGPLESSIRKVAASPHEPENWRRLLLLIAETQGQLDRNKTWRGKVKPVGFLSPDCFNRCWPAPPPEIRLVRAVASIGTDSLYPITANIFGVETSSNNKNLRFTDAERPPRVVWFQTDPLRGLAAILERRLVDTDPTNPSPLSSSLGLTAEDLALFVSEQMDIEMIGKWLAPLSLIDWSRFKPEPGRLSEEPSSVTCLDGIFLWQTFFKPFFSPKIIRFGAGPLFPEHLRPKAGLARRLFYLIRQEEWLEAFALARAHYLASGRPVISFPEGIKVNGALLSAALLVPLSSRDMAHGVKRWLLPAKA
ncbi:MAG: type I-U CRISPR-associated protein Csx17 [Thermodesulfobacteriota bacterium]